MGLGVSALNNDDGVERQSEAPPTDVRQEVKRRRADRNSTKNEPQIGRALRSVYDQTVGEAIPSEMLDLLSKLD